jgi:hypothetical protein
MALSDKAVYIYDTFFSAYITSEKFDSQLEQSSLSRIAFEEVISYPNLLEKMQSHDRYDEIIGIGTTAYNLILSNITREENSKLESNAFIYITTEGRTQEEFDAFLNTVSGHIGFGIIVDNAKTAFDIAESTTAVNLILGNEEALDALLNAPNGLKAFTENPNSAASIFSNAEVFKKLRQYLKFNQTEVFDDPTQEDQSIKYVGGRYFLAIRNTVTSGRSSSFLWSDDLKTWNTASHPTQEFSMDHRWDTIGYDSANNVWFFCGWDTVLSKGSILWNTGDFTGAFTVVAGSFGNSNTLSMTNLNDTTILATYRNTSNQWDLGKIILTPGNTSYELLNVPSYGVNSGYYYMVSGENNVFVSDWGDNGALINQDIVRVGDVNIQQGSTTYYSQLWATYQNGRFWVTQYYSQSGDNRNLIMTFPDEVDYDLSEGGYNYDRYWFQYGTTASQRVLYANGIYIIPIPGGYATSLNGYTWDESLFDVTYSFQLSIIDNRGIVGTVPGTRFVISSYDLGADVSEFTTTTTTQAPELPTGEEGLTRLECLIEGKGINKIHFNKWRILFNEKTEFDNTYYVLENGIYTIENVPETDPLAVLNLEKYPEISYTGDPTKKKLKNVVGSNNDGVYDFYYGDITVKVEGNFGRVSLWSYANGDLGMENIFIHQDFLDGVRADNDTVKADSDIVKASSFTGFTCDGSSQTMGDDIVRVDVTTTTTAAPFEQRILDESVLTTSTTTQYLGDQNYQTGSPLGHESYDIYEQGGELGIQGGPLSTPTLFSSLSSTGYRLTLSKGTYIFNVPDTLSIAIENATSSGNFGPQDSKISYSGDFYKRSIKAINGVPYYFYSGVITVMVDEPFVTVSLYEFSLGYAGAQNCFSWDFSSITTTTLIPTTTTTTIPNTFYTDCLPNEVEFSINGNQEIEFNSESYDPYILHGLGIGQYVIKNVPQSSPITIVNDRLYAKIKVAGDADKNITGAGPDGKTYQYFYGNVKVYVTGDFGRVSYHILNDGYAGGQDKLIYNESCGDQSYVIPTTSTTTRNIPFII